MKIGIYCDPLRARTSATPGRGMVQELIRSRPQDHFILIVRNDYQSSEELREFFDGLKSSGNWELHVEQTSRKILNLKALLGFRNFYKISVDADVFINTDCTALGEDKKPLIITVADLSVFRGKEVSTYRSLIDFRLRRNMLKDGILQADRIVVISETTRNDLSRFFPSVKDRVQIVYNGIDNAWIAAPEIPASSALPGNYFIWWGHISERKNMEGLLKGYAGFITEVANKDEAPSLLIIYNNGMIPASITELIIREGIADKVVFTPRKPLSELVGIVAGSRGLLFPSFVEGFGLPVVEAMAQGVSVLTSSISAMPEVAGGNAILCDPYDVKAITKGIGDLLRPEQWDIRNIENRKARGRMFTYRAAAENYGNIIDNLTKQN